MQCPTCHLAMQDQTVGGEPLERCGTCGGEFSTHQSLRRLLAAHAPPPGASAGGYERPSPLSDPMRYKKCPACADMMLRKNFRDSSGIVVDICSSHGVWFDRGELGMVFAFVDTGAFARAERDAARRGDDRRRLDAFEEDLRSAGPRHYSGLGRGMGVPLDGLADIARIIPDMDDD